MNQHSPFDLEAELSAAMQDFAQHAPAPGYHPEHMLQRRRNRRAAWAGALAAVAAVAALAAGVAWLPGQESRTPPSGQMSPPPTREHSSPPPSDTPRTPADPAENVRELFLAATQFRAGLTEPFDPADIRHMFADDATYERIWGADGSGVTCGRPANGATSVTGLDLVFFHGPNPQGKQATFVPDEKSGRVKDIRCAAAGQPKGKEAIVGYFGGLTKAQGSDEVHAVEQEFTATGFRSATNPDALACVEPRTHAWIAFNPGSATTTGSWHLQRLILTKSLGPDFPVTTNPDGRIHSADCSTDPLDDHPKN